MRYRCIPGKCCKFCVALLLILSLSSGKPITAQKGNSAHGQKVFLERCQRCHDEDGSGNTDFGKALGAADLRSPGVQKETDADLYALIEKGRKNMPPYDGTLSNTEINDVIAYLREIGKKQSNGKK
jgi:mono/diheme cytochrome c family protein